MFNRSKTVLLTIGFTGFLILLFQSFFYVYMVSGHSMNNTLIDGDKVLVRKTKLIKRNDIVIFRHLGETYIKRCIGLPGDLIQLKEGIVFVNRNRLNPSVTSISGTIAMHDANVMIMNYYNQNWNNDNFGPITVPKKGMNGSLYGHGMFERLIQGENSIPDSKSIVPTGKVSGTYTIKNDYYFMLGDNRHHSDDSRIMGVIPEKDIIGVTSTILFSYSALARILKKID